MSNKLGIFPASGGIGGSTLKHVLKLVPAGDVVLVARNPDKLSKEEKAGAIVRKADYDNAQTLDHAFDGVSYLNLISYASIQHEHRFEVQKAAIDSARNSGVKHIFYSSLAFDGEMNLKSKAHVMLAHIDTEKYLARLHHQDPQFTYTIVRQGLYSESFPLYTALFDLKNPSSEICIPHDGSGPGLCWVKQDELGEATAMLMAQHARDPTAFPFLNKTVILSGPRSWSLNETADIFSRVLGRPIRIRQVTLAEYVKQPQLQSGLYVGGEWASIWATAFDAIRDGEAAVVTQSLREILRREPEPFETTIKNMV